MLMSLGKVLRYTGFISKILNLLREEKLTITSQNLKQVVIKVHILHLCISYTSIEAITQYDTDIVMRNNT